METYTQPNPLQFTSQDDSLVKFQNITFFIKSQWNSPLQRRFLLTKIILVTIFFTILILSSSLNIFNHTAPVSCLTDTVQDWTLSITLFFETNVSVRDAVIITSSFLIDLNLVILSLRFLFYAHSTRIVLLIFVFYLVRTFVQRIFFVQFPQHYIFLYPGFFSIAVPYTPSNDFFFSGHVGICTFFFLEFSQDQKTALQGLALVTILLNMFTLLVMRAHYSIDLAVGIVVAHYLYRLSLLMEEKLRTVSNPIMSMCFTWKKARRGEDVTSDDISIRQMGHGQEKRDINL